MLSDVLNRPWRKRSRPRRRARTAPGGLAAAAAVTAAALLPAAVCATPASAAPTHPAHTRTHYYLSLGDSLAAGYQPDAKTNVPGVSYTDQLYQRLKKNDPGLVHVQLGCSGETTTTLLDGGICSYSGARSQLDAATAFLRQHRGQVTTVTLDIGANDVDGCFSASGIDTGCVLKGLATVTKDVPRIAAELRAAGGPGPRYAGMTYYDPFLATWLLGSSGHTLADLSVPLADTLNTVLSTAFRINGFRVADASAAFQTNDFAPVDAPGLGTVPENVARICALTWMCTPYEDIHATRQGHALLADVFQRALEARGTGR
ncbi:SGNH/GDSL hydrolase family protein [Streptomyces sp. PTM05]|uniref:SGNH/GDSL hydrolase family protein n=1 Tax=Streptantibioticus parmotrematis TaxID=2873249 RepID=A0ABS7QK22_9ACTN|nr:SGNH/GDSL hydrolase family protein [Streptantibioticus parmotrematis]MBY8883522.1 SGNH/GDSL hydrolase family protein [Streptantibioticus parmotrematis]